MRANRYVVGAAVLGCEPSTKKSDVVGDFNWAQLAQAFGVYTGQSLNPTDLLYTGGPGQGRATAGAPQNAYWAQQRAAQQQGLAASNLSRQQASQQIQAALRAQQAANLAALQAQLAKMPQNIATAYTPSQNYMPPQNYAPLQPSTTSGIPPTAPSAGWGGAPSPDGSSSDSTDTTTLYDSTTNPGMTILGAAVDPQYLVIKVKNLADVIAKQGGALGNLGYSLTPQTMANLVYGQMASSFKGKLAEQGVDADVTVTADPPTHKPPSSGMLTGAVVGAGAVGLGALLWKYVLKGLI